MKNLTIKDILNCTNGDLIIGDLDLQCINFSIDTRSTNSNDVYIGIKGSNFNGSLFWKEALDLGASCAIVQGIDFSGIDLSNFKNKSIILVEDTLESLMKIAKFKRNLYNDIPVIAITGSVGKTSTKDIVSSVVSQKYKTLKTEGNFNNNIGLPLTILKLKDHEAIVLEMGMNHLKEISILSKIARPTISIITNIGTAHIGNLGSKENILKAKLEILDGMIDKKLIINNDDELLHNFNIEKQNECKLYTYSIENTSNIMATNINFREDYSTFDYIFEGKKSSVLVPIGGKHFVYNALCAATVGILLGETEEQIKHGIRNFELTKKRMDLIKTNDNILIINDSYNASFESMAASLAYLASLPNTRKIAILGDMLELGDYTKELHEKVGIEVSKNKIDLLICSGENSKYIISSAIDNGLDKNKALFFKTTAEISNYIKLNKIENDAILIKASNGMKFYEIADFLK